MKKLLIILSVLVHSVANASVLDDCLKKVSETSEWKVAFTTDVQKMFPQINPDEGLTASVVKANQSKIYSLLAEQISRECSADILSFVYYDRGYIDFIYDDDIYSFNFNIETLFDYIDMNIGFMVMNRRDLQPGENFPLTSAPKKKFFDAGCSDDNLFFNHDDDTAVNVAGRSVFKEFGGDDNEFFLDFAVTDNMRAFPGLVLAEITLSRDEYIVVIKNLKKAVAKYEALGKMLKGGQCSNQGLALYLVDLKKSNTKYEASYAVDALKTLVAWYWLLAPGDIGVIKSVDILYGPYLL